jgi:histidyl-tRNA synthetase
LGLQGYAFKIGHIGVIRGILSQDGVDEKTQNAVLQRMDKKEYDAALKACGIREMPNNATRVD